MKLITIGVLTLLSFHLNAQKMNNPVEAVTHLFVSTDQRNWDGVNASFDSKVLLDYSSMNGNPATELTPEQIISAWKTILLGFESTHHQIGNFQSKTEGNQATVFCYGTANHYLPNEGENVWTVVGTYDFELTLNGQQAWKISSMKFNFKYQSGNLSLPKMATAKVNGE